MRARRRGRVSSSVASSRSPWSGLSESSSATDARSASRERSYSTRCVPVMVWPVDVRAACSALQRTGGRVDAARASSARSRCRAISQVSGALLALSCASAADAASSKATMTSECLTCRVGPRSGHRRKVCTYETVAPASAQRSPRPQRAGGGAPGRLRFGGGAGVRPARQSTHVDGAPRSTRSRRNQDPCRCVRQRMRWQRSHTPPCIRSNRTPH